MNVTRVSLINFLTYPSISKESNMRLVRPIIRSYSPPICNKWGRWKIQTVLLSRRNFCTGPYSTIAAWNPKLSVNPIKLVPHFDRDSFTSPLTATNLLRRLLNDEELISSITSVWTARKTRQENMIVHRLPWAHPLLYGLQRSSKVQMYPLQHW